MCAPTTWSIAATSAVSSRGGHARLSIFTQACSSWRGRPARATVRHEETQGPLGAVPRGEPRTFNLSITVAEPVSSYPRSQVMIL
jgi:hypothetical protein